jgi:hypothetical protein
LQSIIQNHKTSSTPLGTTEFYERHIVPNENISNFAEEVQFSKTKVSRNLHNNTDNNNIQSLILNMLNFYVQKENNLQTEYMYYTHSEYDTSLTEFEGLSNDKRIGIYTNLNKIDATIILQLFQSLYDNNYFLFETENCEVLLSESNICSTDIINLYINFDLNIWIKYLTIYYTTLFGESESDSDIDVETNSDIEELECTYGSTNISNIIPNHFDNFPVKKNKKYYKLEQIINDYFHD